MKSADGARGRREGLAPNTLSPPFRTPATQAKCPICRYQFLNVGGWEGSRGIGQLNFLVNFPTLGPLENSSNVIKYPFLGITTPQFAAKFVVKIP